MSLHGKFTPTRRNGETFVGFFATEMTNRQKTGLFPRSPFSHRVGSKSRLDVTKTIKKSSEFLSDKAGSGKNREKNLESALVFRPQTPVSNPIETGILREISVSIPVFSVLMPGTFSLMNGRFRQFSSLPPWLPFGLSLFPSFF